MFRHCSLVALIVVMASQAFAQERRPSLMVMPFVLEDGQVPRAWVVQAVQESLAADAGRKQIAVVVAPPDRLEPPREARDALAVARDSRADLVVFGVCSLDDQALRVSAQLFDVASGKEVGKLQASGAVRDIVDIQDDLYRQLRGLVLDAPAPAVVVEAPVLPPTQPAVAEPDPALSYRPTYDYSGASFAATGYAYYPAYAPVYVYDPGYIYAAPFCGLYFGYYGAWSDRDRHGSRGHHGWRPSDSHDGHHDTFNGGHHPGDTNDRGPRFHDGVTTLKYATGGHSSVSHVDAMRNSYQGDPAATSKGAASFRGTESSRSLRTVSPGIREDIGRAKADPGRTSSAERPASVAGPSAPPDSPRASSPVPRPAAVSRSESDSPRASSPPPRASAPTPAPAPRAPVSSAPSRGGGGSGRGR